MLKRLSLCCALLFTASLLARADDNKPLTSQGASYMGFTLTGLTNMAAGPITTSPIRNAGGTNTNVNIPVYGLGYRLFISNDMAIRATLGLVMSSTTTKGTDGGADVTDSKTGLQIGGGIEKHMAATNALSGYMGAQFGYLLGSDKNGTSSSSTTQSGHDLTIGVFMGAEWFFNQAMSLGAEYAFGMLMSGGTTTTSSTTSVSTDGPTWFAFGTQSVGIGLNVYIGK